MFVMNIAIYTVSIYPPMLRLLLALVMLCHGIGFCRKDATEIV
jgi:hypothetical protein